MLYAHARSRDRACLARTVSRSMSENRGTTFVAIYEFDGYRPVVHESAFVHPLAAVTGNVVIGRDVYVGPGAAIRADWGEILVGDGSNVQENCVIHVFPGATVTLHESAHIGHGAIIHGATHLPAASMIRAPAGTRRPAPAETIRPLRRTTVPPTIGSDPSPNATVPPTMAMVWADAGVAAAAASAAAASNRII